MPDPRQQDHKLSKNELVSYRYLRFKTNSCEKKRVYGTLRVLKLSVLKAFRWKVTENEVLRTFTIFLCILACARKFTRHVIHKSALSNKINNDMADGLCYSFA